MKLIKINKDHYVVVDDEPIEEGDYCTTHLNVIDVGKIHNSYTIFNPQNKEHLDMVKSCKKITHSTLPLEYTNEDHLHWNKIQPLSLSSVKELIGEVDVESIEEWDEQKPIHSICINCIIKIGKQNIELPTDEEIVAKSKEMPDNLNIEKASRIGYVAGAKWMRDKIQGGNK